MFESDKELQHLVAPHHRSRSPSRAEEPPVRFEPAMSGAFEHEPYQFSTPRRYGLVSDQTPVNAMDDSHRQPIG